MKTTITLLAKIEEINSYLEMLPDDLTLNNLYDSLGGVVLFKQYYSLYHHDQNHSFIKKKIDFFLNHSLFQENYDMSFSNGLSGIAWLMLFLKENNIYEVEELFFEIIDSSLTDNINRCFLEKDYDLFQGLIGYNQYLSCRDNENARKLILSICNEMLLMNCNHEYEIFYFDLFNIKRNSAQGKEIINLGLAHGLPSIIRFFESIMRKEINTTSCNKYIYGLLNKIESYRRPELTNLDNISIYPSDVEYFLTYEVEIINKNSRLGWCYGDLGIGFTQYRIGIFLNDKEIIERGINVLAESALRRSDIETMVFDAGICHGSAGIAHIYNKMWHYTKKEIFKEATDFWIEKTLHLSKFEDGIAGYKMYKSGTKNYENSLGLLEGTTGIGLVLLSYLTGDFDWDYCLMLS